MLSDLLAMNNDTTLAPCPVQAKRKNLRLAWAYQCEAGTRAETNNCSWASSTELKTSLQWARLNLNNTGLKAKLR